jgi:gamma-glutamylcyclotransferase (GGCT)/AIG2-like uncharacterized protein YtfP
LSEPLNHAEILEVGAAVIGLDIKINLFVYGTFLDEKLFESVVGHPAPFEDDALKDYLRIDVGDNYDTLSPEEGRAVYGHRILVSASDLAKTDKWEKDYVRKPVVLASGNEADAYFLREGVHIGNYTVP